MATIYEKKKKPVKYILCWIYNDQLISAMFIIVSQLIYEYSDPQLYNLFGNKHTDNYIKILSKTDLKSMKNFSSNSISIYSI